MGRKTAVETLEAMEAKKKALEQKIKDKKAAIQEKIRAEEARKKNAEKRREDHVKFLLGGFLLNYITKEIISAVLENRDKVDLATDGLKEIKKASKGVYKHYSLKFDNEKDKAAVDEVFAVRILKEMSAYLASPEAYLASLDAKKASGGESVSPSHDQ